METESRLWYLIRRYTAHQCSEEESLELGRLIAEMPDEVLKNQLWKIWKNYAPGRDLSPERSRHVLDYILAHEQGEDAEVFRLPPAKAVKRVWIWAAACLLVAVAGYAVLLNKQTGMHRQIARNNPVKNDVMPGGNRAILTLANGATIILDSVHNGQIADQGNSKIMKVNSGLLTYHPQSVPRLSGEGKAKVLYNMLSTPRGGQYRLVLPDGSKVWLNAASSIRYPTAFTGKERKVDIKGEAYFEVTANENKPFKVVANDMEVTVLGTEFNINAYRDEAAMKTTLIQGRVRVSGGSREQTLVAGEQLQINKKGELTLIEHADTEAAVAWKEGLFSFNNADLPTIMRQLSRWYDIEVLYDGVDSGRRFNGQVFRSLKLSQVLKVLELGGIQCRIEGKKLIISS